MAEKCHVKKGDTVVVISGKDKGKKGKVLEVIQKEGRVVVEGANIATSHIKPTREMQQGGIVKQESPFYSSKVMYFCNKCKKASRIGKKILQDGSRTRICKKCGEVIDK